MFKDVLDNEEERIKLIRDMLMTLTKREEMILRFYYGIENRRGYPHRNRSGFWNHSIHSQKN